MTPLTELLLIEDNPGDARLIREMLDQPGYHNIELTHVQCMGEAERHLALHAVDVILLDLGLPDAQGMEAVKRAQAAAPRVPMVMLTARDDEIFAVQALHEGAQDYLVKGQIDARTLARSLRYAIERNAAERKIRNLNRVHAVLSGISALVLGVHTRDALYREACRVAVDDGGFLTACIGIVDPTAVALRIVACAGDVGNFFKAVPRAPGEFQPGCSELAARAVREKRPLIAQNLGNNPLVAVRQELTARGICSLAFIPLNIRGEAIGVLVLYSGETMGSFDEEEMRLLVQLADNISIGLEHIDKSEKLDYLAYYDPVTGLANRTLFLDRVGQKLLAARDQQRKVAVFAVDIDRFKTVNDALGRTAGDELLRQIAERLRRAGHLDTQFAGVAGDQFAALRDGSRLARVAADHFAVVSTDAQNEEQLAQLTESNLRRCFSRPFHIGTSELRISAKIGIAVFPSDGVDAETLLSNATAAVRKAKVGQEHYAFYSQKMHARSIAALTLENRLRRGLERDEFVLHYQPKVELRSRRIIGVEALVRWQSPDLGLVPPLQFIPLMEETGMILELGVWALRKAVADHVCWMQIGLPPVRVAVNVSAIQFHQKDFIRSIRDALERGGGARCLDLELTETLIMDAIDNNIEKLRELRALGVGIAIDDFGTGYSSLAYLAKLPVETLKIDRSFVSMMLGDADTLTLVQTIVSLAHSLRLKVVAEGVESQEQAGMLELLRCDEIQGYLFSEPVPADALASLLTSYAGARTPGGPIEIPGSSANNSLQCSENVT